MLTLLNSLHNPEHSHKKVIPYNLQFSTDIHVQQAMTSHGPEGHRNRETVRLEKELAWMPGSHAHAADPMATIDERSFYGGKM